MCGTTYYFVRTGMQHFVSKMFCFLVVTGLLCAPGCVVIFFGFSGFSDRGGVTYKQQCSWAFVPHAVVAVGRAASLVFCLRSLLALCPQCVPPEGPDDNDNDNDPAQLH